MDLTGKEWTGTHFKNVFKYETKKLDNVTLGEWKFNSIPIYQADNLSSNELSGFILQIFGPTIMKYLIYIILFNPLLFAKNLFAQTKAHKNIFFFSSGVGPVYSFFEIATPPDPSFNAGQYTIEKKLLGRAIDFEVGHLMQNKFRLSLRFSDHKFSKKFNVFDTLRNANYEYTLIGKLYRHQYYYQLLINKIFAENRHHSFGAGTGILFINDGQQFFAAYSGAPNLFNPAVSLHEYRNWEFGVPAAIFYEKKLNENISFGIKAQAYILISVGSFESISLNPYIKASF